MSDVDFENHPLFTEEFATAPVRTTQWAAFVRKNKIDDAPSFAEVVKYISERLLPICGSLR